MKKYDREQNIGSESIALLLVTKKIRGGVEVEQKGLLDEEKKKKEKDKKLSLPFLLVFLMKIAYVQRAPVYTSCIRHYLLLLFLLLSSSLTSFYLFLIRSPIFIPPPLLSRLAKKEREKKEEKRVDFIVNRILPFSLSLSNRRRANDQLRAPAGENCFLLFSFFFVGSSGVYVRLKSFSRLLKQGSFLADLHLSQEQKNKQLNHPLLFLFLSSLRLHCLIHSSSFLLHPSRKEEDRSRQRKKEKKKRKTTNADS